MALPTPFLEDLRARSPLPELIGRRVRLARSGRQWKGCCPFHDEKTPSFYVYDDHFHCFGCGAHGDAISFVMQSQGLGFMEAVEQLAAAAGLSVPKPSPEAEVAERVRQDLFSVLEAAGRAFTRRLFLPEGKAALAYLRGRGLADATIRDFGLGWSGEGRGGLAAELAREGIAPDRLIAAGLMKQNEESKSYEFFFSRVMFPIRDSRGRVVSFGGRTLGDGEPKYLNGPETELFSKRRTLYGLDRAREGLRTSPPIVVEGYMDVIALHQAGFPTAVAPLGTALTEEQLGVLWRYAEAPVICFDGDPAGRRAAGRAIDLALPLLTPERTLAFALLDDGEDPDSLIRKRGDEAFRAVLDAPRQFPTAHFHWVRDQTGDATWRDKVKLRTKLRADANRIPDWALRDTYRQELDQLFERNYPRRQPAGTERRGVGFMSHRITQRTGLAVTEHRAVASPSATSLKRVRQLTATLLRYPELLHRVEERYAGLELPPALDELRKRIFEWADTSQELDSAGLMSHLNASGLTAEAVRELDSMRTVVSGGVTLPDAELGWRQTFDLLVRIAPLEEEKEALERSFAGAPDAATQRRLIAIKEELDSVRQGGQEETAE
jgi:DNA primase